MDYKESNLFVLSVVTVASFEQERLERTLSSLVSVNSEIEHVVIIPKSDLDSKARILRYKSEARYPVTIGNDDGIGIYAAMNLGVSLARGKYVHFLNAGDEILDQSVFSENISSLRNSEETWAIMGCSLPWNSMYSTFLGMDRKFLRQEKNSYVSHQTVLARRNALIALDGFDTSFKVAADILMTMKLSNLSAPVLLSGISVKVEAGRTVTASNRLSRLETIKAILMQETNRDKFLAIRNFTQREIHFILKKIYRDKMDYS